VSRYVYISEKYYGSEGVQHETDGVCSALLFGHLATTSPPVPVRKILRKLRPLLPWAGAALLVLELHLHVRRRGRGREAEKLWCEWDALQVQGESHKKTRMQQRIKLDLAPLVTP
jgi:hypothetical protein